MLGNTIHAMHYLLIIRHTFSDDDIQDTCTYVYYMFLIEILKKFKSKWLPVQKHNRSFERACLP